MSATLPLTTSAAISPVSRLTPFEVTPLGFILRDGDEARDYLDTSVVSLSVSERPAAVGLSHERQRIFRLKFVDDTKLDAVRIADRIDAGSRDPLQGFLERLTSHLVRKYRAAIRAGDSLAGAGWILDLAGITTGQGKQIPFCDISCAEWVLEDFCIWSSEPEAVLRLPASAENVMVLAELLPEFLAARRHPVPGMGRILFEIRSGSQGMIPFRGPALAAVALVGLLALIGSLSWGTVAAVIAISLIWGAIRRTGGDQRIVCCERGIRISGQGNFAIASEELSGVRIERSLAGAVVTLQQSGKSAPRVVRLTQLTEQGFACLDRLEEMLSTEVGITLLKQLVETGSVPWTETVSVQLDGLTLTRGQESARALFSQIGAIAGTATGILVRTSQTNTPLLTVSRNEMNALAGWKLIENVRQVVQEVAGGSVPHVTR